MYQIVLRDNCWHITRSGIPVLFGIGGIQTAIEVGRLHGIFLTFKNYETEKVA